ncbi:hypothetical protein V1524DRAFT_178470 [Lipomyces starkeyi]
MSSENSPVTSVSSIRSKWEQMAVGGDNGSYTVNKKKERNRATDLSVEAEGDTVRPLINQQGSNGIIPTAKSISESVHLATTPKSSAGDTKVSVGSASASLGTSHRDPSSHGSSSSSTPRQGPPPLYPKPQTLTSTAAPLETSPALAQSQPPVIVSTGNESTDGQVTGTAAATVSATSATYLDGSHESHYHPPEIKFNTKPVLRRPSAAVSNIGIDVRGIVS